MGSLTELEPAPSKGFRVADLLVVAVGGMLVYAAVAMLVVTDKQRIERLLDAGVEAFGKEDLPACLETLDAGEAVFMSPGAAQEGVALDQIRAMLERFFADFFDIQLTFKRREVVVGEGTARVNFSASVRMRANEPAVQSGFTIRGTLGLVRRAPEVWKIKRVEVIEIRGGTA
ncbi:MAG: nuclear transport factor 2 family protein [Candidatus Wallbacteria bacterium]|nr:nuclear transport factor 2 family protein [Candidatus Wallbacteria bacterium]